MCSSDLFPSHDINAKKKAGTSKPKSKSTVDPKEYAKMKKGWKK